METIAESLLAVRERMAKAAALGGRAPESTRLVAVSKTVSAEAVREAYAAGQRDFGENYVQELAAKREALADLQDLRWHMIGHVQKNKARYLATGVAMIHSVSSRALARELGLRRAARSAEETLPLPVLIEVNIGGEAQKCGSTPQEAHEVAAAIDAEPSLKLAGLMTVPPHTKTPEGARPFFEALSVLRDELGGSRRLPELSMGMSYDLEQAILAGATMVRVGTLIFGARTPKV